MKKDDGDGRFRWRTLTSLVTALLFATMLASGLVLYLAPDHGAGRRWWSVWGLDTLAWGSLHSTIALLFALSCAVHLGFNLRALVRCVRRRRELCVGVAIAALLVAGALFDLPPISALSAAQDELRAGTESHSCAHQDRGGRGWRGGRGQAGLFP